MTYENLRSTIKTGDLLGCHGRNWTDLFIDLFTSKGDPTAWTHVGVFYWDSQGLWIAQEYEGTGFGCYPASQLIGKFMNQKADCFLGRAPLSISDDYRAVTDLLTTWRRSPSLHPYGYGTLLRILDDPKEDPDSVPAVCSTFAQEAWEATGFKFAKLFAPEDFKAVVTEIVPIQ